MMCDRANSREAFGGPLADKQFIQDFIAKSRMEIDQARLLTLYAAWKMDTEGKRARAPGDLDDQGRRRERGHGRARPRDPDPRRLGMSDDTPLAAMWRFSRMLRIADGPDEVHKMVIARRELGRRAKLAAGDAESDGAAAPQPAKA